MAAFGKLTGASQRPDVGRSSRAALGRLVPTLNTHTSREVPDDQASCGSYPTAFS
jgi:hypothetical protein